MTIGVSIQYVIPEVCVHAIFICHYIICLCSCCNNNAKQTYQYPSSSLAHLDPLDKLPMMNSRQTASSLMCPYGSGTSPFTPETTWDFFPMCSHQEPTQFSIPHNHQVGQGTIIPPGSTTLKRTRPGGSTKIR